MNTKTIAGVECVIGKRYRMTYCTGKVYDVVLVSFHAVAFEFHTLDGRNRMIISYKQAKKMEPLCPN